MVRGGQYLSIDIKTKFIETLVAKIQGGVQLTANLHHYQDICTGFVLESCLLILIKYKQFNVWSSSF